MSMQKLNDRFPEKCAFITGSGSGLGASFARILMENNWKLFLSDIDSSSLDVYKDSPNVHCYALDVSDRPAYENVVEQVSQATERMDVVINNAGIGDGELFGNYAMDQWEKMVNVNLLGTYYGSRLLLPLLERGGGLIINIASAAGFMNAPGMSAYNATKAAVYSLSETLHHEFKRTNIQISVAAPTFFQTNIMSKAHGSQPFIRFAENQMKHSSTNADEMAEIILSEAGAGKFLIVHPKEARRNMWIKRYFPGLVSKKFEKLLAKLTRD